MNNLFFPLLILFSLLLSCKERMESVDVKSNGDTLSSCFKPLLETEIGEIVNRDFNKYYKPYFRQQDSCTFRAFIRSEYSREIVAPYSFFDSTYIYNGTCDNLTFSFSIVGSPNRKSYYYYGLYDIFALTFSDAIYPGQIISYENETLSKILNEFVKPKHLFGIDQAPYLDTYISKLCFSGIYGLRDVKEPVFDRILSYYELRNGYRNEKNSKDFDQVFNDRARMLILDIEYLGVVAFVYDFKPDGSFAVNEYLLPKIGRLQFSRNDSNPDYKIPCLK